jgi:hypothetical protein
LSFKLRCATFRLEYVWGEREKTREKNEKSFNLQSKK